MGVVGGAHADGPGFHGLRHLIGDFTIDFGPGRDGAFHAGIGIARQVLEHPFLVEYVLAENFGTTAGNGGFGGVGSSARGVLVQRVHRPGLNGRP